MAISTLTTKYPYPSRRSLRTACSLMTPNPVNGLTVRKRPGKAGARTRSMSGGQLYLPSGLLGTTAEDVGNPVRAVHSSSSSVCSKKRLSSDKSPSEPRPASECNGTKLRRRFRPRRSQLAVLSDEAQNFMFREPTVHDSSSEPSSSDEDVDSCERLNIKIEPDCLDTSGERRRKRRSQAEAFITDNRDYYKFETPGSRLRFHDDRDMELNNKSATVNNKDKDNIKECVGKVFADVKKVELNGGDESNSIKDDFTNGISTRGMDDFTFSFEKVPESEPWFQTFQRQDRGEEFYFSNPCSDAPFLLPYELLPLRFPFVGFRGGGRGRGRRGRRRRGHLERKPRKSPRCHASTLAILSGFIQRRKRDPARVKEPVLKVEPPPPAVINPPIRTETDAEMLALADTLDRALEISGDELELGDVSVDQATTCCGLDLPLASLLDADCPCCSRVADACAPAWHRRKKKKRKNLTGWPNAKKAKIVHGVLLKPALAKGQLFSDDFLVDDTNESDCYTSCDGASERPESRDDGERTEADVGDKVATARFSSANNCGVDDDGMLGLPEYCVPNTRRLRSAGTRLARRESPRKIKN